MAKQQALRTNDLISAFGVTGLTLLSWRKGTPTKEKLPVDVQTTPGGRNTVSYNEAKVRAWAKKHNLEFKLKEVEEPKKAGPVAKLEPKPKKVKSS